MVPREATPRVQSSNGQRRGWLQRTALAEGCRAIARWRRERKAAEQLRQLQAVEAAASYRTLDVVECTALARILRKPANREVTDKAATLATGHAPVHAGIVDGLLRHSVGHRDRAVLLRSKAEGPPQHAIGRIGQSKSAFEKAVELFAQLDAREQQALMQKMQRELATLAYEAFENRATAHAVRRMADFFAAATEHLPKDKEGAKITAGYETTMRILRRVIEDTEHGDAKSKHPLTIVACTRALWELEYVENNQTDFWEERLRDPVTRNFMIRELLEMPHRQDVKEQDHGWHLLREYLNVLGADIARSPSLQRDAFLLDAIGRNDTETVAYALHAASTMEALPEGIVAAADARLGRDGDVRVVSAATRVLLRAGEHARLVEKLPIILERGNEGTRKGAMDWLNRLPNDHPDIYDTITDAQWTDMLPRMVQASRSDDVAVSVLKTVEQRQPGRVAGVIGEMLGEVQPPEDIHAIGQAMGALASVPDEMYAKMAERLSDDTLAIQEAAAMVLLNHKQYARLVAAIPREILLSERMMAEMINLPELAQATPEAERQLVSARAVEWTALLEPRKAQLAWTLLRRTAEQGWPSSVEGLETLNDMGDYRQFLAGYVLVEVHRTGRDVRNSLQRVWQEMAHGMVEPGGEDANDQLARRRSALLVANRIAALNLSFPAEVEIDDELRRTVNVTEEMEREIAAVKADLDNPAHRLDAARMLIDLYQGGRTDLRGTLEEVGRTMMAVVQEGQRQSGTETGGFRKGVQQDHAMQIIGNLLGTGIQVEGARLQPMQVMPMAVAVRPQRK